MTKDYCAPSNEISAKTVPLPPPSERAQTIFNNKREAGSLRMKDPACAYNTLGAVSTDWPNPMAHNHTAQPVPLQNLVECMPADHDNESGQGLQQPWGRSVLKDWSIPMAANPARTSAIPQARASSFTGKSGCRQHLNIAAVDDACKPQLRGDCSSEFWKLGQNAKREIWVDQFFSLEEEYYETMSAFKPASTFHDPTQILKGQMNPSFDSRSIGTFSAFGEVTTTFDEASNNLYSFSGDYDGSAYEESNQDAYLNHIYNVCSEGEDESPVQVELPYDGMLENFEVFHSSVSEYLDKVQADKQMEFELLSEPQVVYVADANGRTVPMATVMMLVKSIQGVPCSKIMNVLLDSGGSASMISKKALPKGVQVDYGGKQIVATLAGHVESNGKVNLQGL